MAIIVKIQAMEMITLNLNEMLIYADIQHINKIVDHYQCQCDRHSKTEMIQSIIYTLFQNNTLEEMIDQLTDIERTFVQLLYLDSRTKYTIEDLLAKGKQAIELQQSNEKPREIVLTALKKGWIFQGVGKKHLLIYLVPEDLKKKILQSLIRKLQKQVLVKEEIPFYRDEIDLLFSDLLTFLNTIRKEDIYLTNEGNIYKRQQYAIFQSFIIPEEPLKRQAFRFGYGRRYDEYPDRFSLLYDYAYYQKWIDEGEKGFLGLTTLGIQWVERSHQRMKESKKLYQFWVRLYKHPIPFLPLIVRFIDLMSYQQWVRLDHLQELTLFWLKDHYYEKKEQIFQERIIKMMLHLGLIQLGNDDGIPFLRVTEEGHHWINDFESFEAKEIVY